MWKSRFAAPAALILAIALPTAASADSQLREKVEYLKRENAEMKRMLMRLQQQMQDILIQTEAMRQQDEKAAEEGDPKGGGAMSGKEDITITTTGGGIQVKSSKGNEFRIGGRLMFDLDSYDDFWADNTVDEETGKEREGSGEENEIRRSRITLSGKSGKNWSYKFTTDIDHEDSEASVDTGYLKYSRQPMYAMFGKHKRPAMLEERTSSKWISTIERSIVNELSGAVVGKPDFGGVSVGFATEGEMPMSGAIGLYDDEIEEDDGGDAYGIGARFSVTPKFDDGSFMHAGASIYSVDYKGANHRMRTRMGVHTTGRPFDAGSHYSDDVDQLGVELAYVDGPFSLQGEFMNVESDGTDNSACGSGTYDATDPEPKTGFTNTCDLEMDGFYLQSAYTLTGETRGYKASSGAFAAIKPKNEGGAWELVARYEDADIDVPGRSINADLERLVLGVNWYVNKNVKFMLNYVDAEVDCSTTTRPYLTTDGSESTEETDPLISCNYDESDKDDGDAVSLRGQYAF